MRYSTSGSNLIIGQFEKENGIPKGTGKLHFWLAVWPQMTSGDIEWFLLTMKNWPPGGNVTHGFVFSDWGNKTEWIVILLVKIGTRRSLTFRIWSRLCEGIRRSCWSRMQNCRKMVILIDVELSGRLYFFKIVAQKSFPKVVNRNRYPETVSLNRYPNPLPKPDTKTCH